MPLDEKSRKVILASLHGLSTKAPRCLGFAYMEDLAEFATYDGEYHPPHMLLLNPANYVAIETDLIFAGLADLRVRLNMFCINAALHFIISNLEKSFGRGPGFDNMIFCTRFLSMLTNLNCGYFSYAGSSKGRGL